MQGGHCVVLVSGIILAQYAAADRMAEAHAMVSLVEQGWAGQVEVARAFHCSERTVRRISNAFEESGLAGFGQSGRLSPWALPLGRLAAAIGAATQEPRACAAGDRPADRVSVRTPFANSCDAWDGKCFTRPNGVAALGAKRGANQNRPLLPRVCGSLICGYRARCAPKPVRFLHFGQAAPPLPHS